MICGEDAPAALGQETRYKQVFEEHNAAVLSYFKDRPGDLLVMDLEGGDGWTKLCPFVGAPVPGKSFERANSARARRGLVSRIARRIRRLGLPVGSIVR